MSTGQKQKIDQIIEWIEKVDYYQLLGVKPNATGEDLKKAYFALSKQYHPDRYFSTTDKAGRDKITTVFKRLNEAYTVLKASAKRARYDKNITGPDREKHLRFQLSDDDRGGPPTPESYAKTPNGKKYLKLAYMAQQKKDWKNVEMNVKFALGFEADNEYLKKLLETAKAEIAKLPKQDPFKIR